MRGLSGAGAAILIALAAGCAQAPPPAYQPPTELEARLAYKDALRAALKEPGDPNEGPPPGGEESYIEAMARGGRIARAERAIESNATLLKSIASLSQAELEDCAWTALDVDEATGGTEDDSSTYPEWAWHCSVRIVHRTDGRGQVEAGTDGWFFRNGDKFVYVGKAAHGFKRTIDIERGLT